MLGDSNIKLKQSSRMKKWRAANGEKIRAYQKDWRERNRTHVAEYQKTYHEEYRQRPDVRDKVRTRNLELYGLTNEGFNEIWTAQDGRCAICDIPLKPLGRDKDSVTVDHNHDTDEVRGLLCRSCNAGIGALKDSPAVLIAAAEYLLDNGDYCSDTSLNIGLEK